MSTMKELWAKVGPEAMPELASSSDVIEAFKEGRITREEVQRLEKAIERRTTRYLRSQGYEP